MGDSLSHLVDSQLTGKRINESKRGRVEGGAGRGVGPLPSLLTTHPDSGES